MDDVDGGVRVAVSQHRPRRRWPVPVAVALALIGLTVASYAASARTDDVPARPNAAQYLADGDTPVIGTTYALDLTVLCRSSVQHFGAGDWEVSAPRAPYPGPSKQIAGSPAHNDKVHGYATLIDHRTLLFRTDTTHTKAAWELTLHPSSGSTPAPACASEQDLSGTRIVP